MQCKVSVIIPVYNGEKYLAQCIDSVLGQSLMELEIICVDDGSTDESTEILRSFAERDSRVKIIKQKNRGAGAARNKGLGVARGEYLSFLDADDLFEHEMLEIAYNEAKSNSADMVIFDADIFDNDTGKKLPSNWIVDKQAIPDGTFGADDIRDEIFTVCFQVAWNRLFSARYISEHGIRFQEIEKHNDSYFSVMTMLHAKRMRYMNAVLIHYRKGTQTQISSNPIGERDFLPVLDALIAIHDEILTMDTYDAMLKSFLNYSTGLLLNAFHRIGQEDYFRAFDLVKEQWISRFPRRIFREEDFKNRLEYRQLVSIIENDATKHLFALLNMKDREIDALKLNRKWFFSDERPEYGCDIVLYGAGDVGTDYYRQLIDSKRYRLTAWLDADYLRYREQGLHVSPPCEISELQYDWVIIAVLNEPISDRIMYSLLGYGVPRGKIIWPFEKLSGVFDKERNC